eukprot:CAMPEP_0172521328 /NCGR_PEP_ID=MMETSP1066-20121228/292516_1 /TAXON_ID=671091 /ORGANISM="Coscinodiscus wailesii, Strain CCMP2513" /LENGTH=549 /DNA_ID=CAMNT_0013304229 /DNA_START=726 /DNA_END=2375 /DNA_ORIENTATION=-
MKPCGYSVFQHLIPFGRCEETGKTPYIKYAGSFVYLDITDMMLIPPYRKMWLFTAGNMMEELKLSVEYVVKREEFTKQKGNMLGVLKAILMVWIIVLPRLIWNLIFCLRPEDTSEHYLNFIEDRILKAKSKIMSCDDKYKRVVIAKNALSTLLFEILLNWAPKLMSGIISFGLMRKLIEPSPTSEQDLNALMRGLPGNVTTEMDLEIGDLADVARTEPQVSAWLQNGKDLTLHGLSLLPKTDSLRFRDALSHFLDKYGSRGNAEIDISRPRWRDNPAAILHAISGNLTNTDAGHHREHHQRLVKEGEEAGKRLVALAPWYKRPILRRLVRNGRGYGAIREHHKFLMIRLMGELRKAILNVAQSHVDSKHLNSVEDIWMLHLDEIVALPSMTEDELQALVCDRKEHFQMHSKLKPPRVLTSEGECVNVMPNSKDIPDGALGGLGTSSGIVEGVVNVILDPHSTVLHSGEILVTRCTDPGWTPLFINAAGLVMEVGGYLTHGSVVSREYGIPAVSCIADATSVLKTGMRVRVDGTRGYVEILQEGSTDERN